LGKTLTGSSFSTSDLPLPTTTALPLQPSIIASGALASLLAMVSNPEDLGHKYLEMETRRESAKALANLAEEYSSAIVQQIGKVRRRRRRRMMWSHVCGWDSGIDVWVCSVVASLLLLLLQEAVSQWMQSVDTIHDDRLRMHARRIKSRVRYCC